MISTRHLLALAAGALVSLVLVRVFPNEVGAVLLLPAVLLASLALFSGEARVRSLSRGVRRGLIGFIAVAVTWSFVVDLRFAVGQRSLGTRLVVLLLVAAALVAAAGVVLNRHSRASWWLFIASFGVLALVVLLLGDPGGIIDVAVFQTDSVKALVDGVNPYALRFLDPYAADASARFYGPGVSVDGILQFGYPYFPLTLIVIVPFEVLLGDHRIAFVAATMLTAIAIGAIRDDRVSRTAAIVYLLGAPVFYVHRWGWVDPVTALAAASVVLVAARTPRWQSWATGVLFATKQYVVFAVLPSLLLLPRPLRLKEVVKHFAQAAVPFLIVTLPFVAWNPREFYRSVVALQFVQPFRPDSIALTVLIPGVIESTPRVLVVGVSFLVVAGISIVAILRAPTGPSSFAIATGLIMLVAFATSKQAFANYYLVVIAFLCAGVAALPALDSGASSAESPDTSNVESAAAQA